MACEQGIHFDPKLRLLVCQVHGFGVHPAPQAITRHLRGEGHRCRSKALKHALLALISLPLRSLDEVKEQYPPVDTQPISPPISHLRILSGWMCLLCNGHYLTTSNELVHRHAATKHGRRRGDAPLWTTCRLQTFFLETKDRRYFRVRNSQISDPSSVKQTGNSSNRNVELSPTRQKPDRRRDLKSSLTPQGYIGEPRASPMVVHPFALLAESHISGFSVEYLNDLFRSKSFKAASEPLFDPSHVDSQNNMQSVFPACDDDPLFYHALVYSMIRSLSGRQPTVESMALERRIVDLVYIRQAESPNQLSQARVGAIMLLKTTAYKLEDAFAHGIHSQGLRAVLASFGIKHLNSKARRALFWQDLYGTVFLDCETSIEPVEIFDNVKWAREISCDTTTPALPAGFSRHRHLLPQSLLDVVIDLQELKTYLPILAQLPWHMRYQHLDSMQASIESRLVRQAKGRAAVGPITESVRLAVFLCCYCAWMEIWNDHFIPCKLAERLLDVLEPTVLPDELFVLNWGGRLDLLLWLAFVYSTVVEMEEGRIERLRSRRKQLWHRIESMLGTFGVSDVGSVRDQALTDFIYCEWWSKDSRQVWT